MESEAIGRKLNRIGRSLRRLVCLADRHVRGQHSKKDIGGKNSEAEPRNILPGSQLLVRARLPHSSRLPNPPQLDSAVCDLSATAVAADSR
jgi:hypothetical protein